MNAGKLLLTIAVVCSLCAFSSQVVAAKRPTKTTPKSLFRIEDEQGRTIYTDQIPAEKNSLRQERLNPQGRAVETKEKERSREQQIMDARLAALRVEEQKLIARQKLHDEALLSTFHSKEDIAAALEVKMQGFAEQRQLLQSSLKQTSDQLDYYLKVAAEFERSGQKPSAAVVNNIALTQQKIEQVQAAIRGNMDKQQLTQHEYEADVERYLFLTQTTKKTREEALVPSVKDANSLGLFYCDNDHQCNKAWHLARDFINQYSTTQPNIFNEKLIMNRPPATSTDISLSLSRIALTDNDYLLFLDILCHDSATGRELCASDRVKDIRARFRPYINDVLARSGK